LPEEPGVAAPGQDEAIVRAADLIASSRYVVAMTGAGMSVESGIPAFRGRDGLWTKFGQPPMDGFRRFREDPSDWWQRRVNREMDEHIIHLRDALLAAQPHAGHHALARLEQTGMVKHVVTQNIDGLDLKAGLKNLIEIHGNRSRLRCIGCGNRTHIGDFIPQEPPEPCGTCGGIVKFDTVMFGEPVPADTMAKAREQIDLADCILVVGTSATVRPASGLLWIAKANGARLIEVNPAETKLTGVCDVVARATAGQAMPSLVERLAGTTATPLGLPSARQALAVPATTSVPPVK